MLVQEAAFATVSDELDKEFEDFTEWNKLDDKQTLTEVRTGKPCRPLPAEHTQVYMYTSHMFMFTCLIILGSEFNYVFPTPHLRNKVNVIVQDTYPNLSVTVAVSKCKTTSLLKFTELLGASKVAFPAFLSCSPLLPFEVPSPSCSFRLFCSHVLLVGVGVSHLVIYDSALGVDSYTQVSVVAIIIVTPFHRIALLY